MSATAHLTAEAIRAYRARSLDPDRLLAAAEHLAACEECRGQVASPESLGLLAEALGETGHLEYEALEELARGGTVADTSLDHLSSCATCAEELKDLRSFRASLKRPRSRLTPWFALIPVAALLALGVALFLHRPGTVAAPPRPAPLVALRDGGRMVTLAPSGEIGGLEGVPPEERDAIAAALRDHRVTLPPTEPALTRSRETQLGGPSGAVRLWPESPAGEIVYSDRPVFRWASATPARSARVEIYDENFNLAASLPNGVWTSRKPLRRGAVYSWTVSAVVGGARITAPRAPEPEAKFRVASAAEAQQFEAILAARPASDLRDAVAAARLGFREEARAAVDRLAAQNPGSTLPDALREALLPPHAK